jgi:hypothetical protein
LSEEQVNWIYENGENSLRNFATRLFRKYFSLDEILAIESCRFQTIEKLDRVRIDFIKGHLEDRKGSQLNDSEWRECVSAMLMRAYCMKNQRRKKISK